MCQLLPCLSTNTCNYGLIADFYIPRASSHNVVTDDGIIISVESINCDLMACSSRQHIDGINVRAFEMIRSCCIEWFPMLSSSLYRSIQK